MNPNQLHQNISQVLQNAESMLLVSHVRADGDAIGSLLGMGLTLQSVGKKVQMVLPEGVPLAFRHLEGSQQIIRRAEQDYDISIVLDCSDLQRIGDVLEDRMPDLNIDHHVTNLNFARLNLVDVQAVATSAILAEHLPTWGLAITQPAACALLFGLVSDTLGFRTSNTNAKALRLSADLIDLGANLAELYHLALIQRSYEAARLWGIGLSRLQKQGGLVWTRLTLQDKQEADYPGNDDADLINMLSGITESDVCVIFVEQTGGRVKVSWRARAGLDVSQIAVQFGGGGHPAASGATIVGTMEEVQDRVLSATQSIIENGVQLVNERIKETS